MKCQGYWTHLLGMTVTGLSTLEVEYLNSSLKSVLSYAMYAMNISKCAFFLVPVLAVSCMFVCFSHKETHFRIKFFN